MKHDVLKTKNLSVFYGQKRAVNRINIAFRQKEVTAIIGPSGCGKSTLLRCLNRMNDFIDVLKIEGEISYYGQNINHRSLDVALLRRNIGMVFQRPNPFPKSIYQNITWGPKLHGTKDNLDELVESSLTKAAIWDEVKDRLHDPASALSGGQQQRLCIARAIAMKPEVILMDEPCSALDPKSTARVENLIEELKSDYTIIIVTHNMQQASRVSDKTAFFYEGELIEVGNTAELFTNPKEQRTEDYITGRFGYKEKNMSLHFNNELMNLRNNLLTLMEYTEKTLELSVQSMKDNNKEIAKEVLSGDDQIDSMEVEIEEDCLKILALYHPVASDLRFIITVLKVINDLERIGDLAVNISERALFLSTMNIKEEPPFDFEDMATKTKFMLREAINSLIDSDVEKAVLVCKKDDEVDQINRDMYKHIHNAIQKCPSQVDYYLQYFSNYEAI